MNKIPPALVISSITVCIIAGAAIFIILPLHGTVTSTRQKIDTTRANIVSLKQQQQNIESVSKNFSTLSENEASVRSVFLTENTTVDFFNELDNLSDQYQVKKFQKHLDAPSAATGSQVVALRLSFQADYAQTLRFMRALQQLKVLIRFNTINIHSDQVTTNYTVDIDSSIPWTIDGTL